MSDDIVAGGSLALDTESAAPAVYTTLTGDVARAWDWLRGLDPSLPESPPELPPDTLGQGQPTMRLGVRLVVDGHGVVTLQVSTVLSPAVVERLREAMPMIRLGATMLRGMGGGGPAPMGDDEHPACAVCQVERDACDTRDLSATERGEGHPGGVQPLAPVGCPRGFDVACGAADGLHVAGCSCLPVVGE